MIKYFSKIVFGILLALAGQQFFGMAAAIDATKMKRAIILENQFIALCEKGSLEAAQALLTKYPEININARGDGSAYNREAALICAERHGHMDDAVALLLIETCRYADLKARGTPLYWAARGGHMPLVTYLVAHGATLAQHRMGDTELHAAAANNSLEMAQLFIKMGAKVNAKDDDGYTPLHRLLQSKYLKQGDLEMVRYLYTQNADINAKDKVGVTPLHIAIEIKDLEIARFLLEHGAATVYAGDEAVVTMAARLNLLEMTKLLLTYGADANGSYEAPWGLPIFRAARHGNHEIMEVLIKNHADVNMRFKDGDTLLHWIIEVESKNRLKMVNLLLENGADAMAIDAYGNTPLHKAVESLWEIDAMPIEILKILIAKGAKLYAKNKCGMTPMDYARRYKDRRPADVAYLAQEMARESTLHALLACETLINSDGKDCAFPPELIVRVLHPCIVAAEMVDEK